MNVYNKYSDFLKQKYHDKVYKIPVNLPVTCPNRDGTCGKGGCTFCGEIGAGYEMQSENESVKMQLETNSAYISKKFKAKRFIAYLQNYSNTYMPLDQFKTVLDEIYRQDIVGISLSTRPDCIHSAYLKLLKEWSLEHKKDVCIELGLQTVNYHSLSKVNRGHSLAEYLDAVFQIKHFGFQIGTHIILNLPWDTMKDVIETAKCMSALHIDFVKLHALYIVKGTPLEADYLNKNIMLLSLEDYKQRVITFLRYLSNDIVLERLIGRAPEVYTVFANWNTSWWKIHDDIVSEMVAQGYRQGDLCDYLNGKAVKKYL